MEVKSILLPPTFFSICVPQYNRTSFLIEACKTLANQTFKDFEVCISDDCSTDGREQELLNFLERSGLSFIYRKQERNQRYDGNLRTSISLARGRFCFLLGNDDALVSPMVLQGIYHDIQRFGPSGVVVTNYEDFSTRRVYRRIRKTGVIGRGPEVAAAYFRDFSFVSGILLDREKASQHATSKWDGSEMYQMFVGCRIIAEGAPLLGIDRVAVRQGIRLPGERVDSYASRPRVKPWPIQERGIPLSKMGALVCAAIAPSIEEAQRERIFEEVFTQIYRFTYPFWIFEYRRVQNWAYAAGICLGMRPRRLLAGISLSWVRRVRLSFLYGVVTVCGLWIPIRLFRALQETLYAIAKRPRLTRVFETGSP